MAKTRIPQKVQSALWGVSGGRCQYRGCNHGLIGDLIAGKEDGTFGFIAHIVADAAYGPRGCPIRSPQLAKSLENLMLLCGTHHKMIDVDAVEQHPEALLLDMKREHELRTNLVTGVDHDRASHVVRFAARIGQNEALVSTRALFAAMLPHHHPADGRTIDLELVGCAYRDDEPAYYRFQRDNLRRKYQAQVEGRIEQQDIRHLSVFALAPQPLLIELGRLMGDIVPAQVMQQHREPSTWGWQLDQPRIAYATAEPQGLGDGAIALKIGISATLTDDTVRAALGPGTTVWSISAEGAHNDILRDPRDQAEFRTLVRRLLNRIKAVHGDGREIHLFPAMPASLAVELGRVWMPKADLPLVLYDRHGERWTRTFTLGHDEFDDQRLAG